MQDHRSAAGLLLAGLSSGAGGETHTEHVRFTEVGMSASWRFIDDDHDGTLIPTSSE
jgi:hypothetical protein